MQMHRLRCFMYVSTAYSNSHVERYSLVKEQLYSMKDAQGNVADHKAIVERLLGMPADEAMQEASPAPQLCGFLMPWLYAGMATRAD